MEEKLIPAVTALFILSIVSERIVEFIKRQFSGKGIVPNLQQRYPDGSTEEEKRISRNIILSIICGIATALIFKADLYAIITYMMTDHSGDNLGIGWHDIYPYFKNQCLDYVFSILLCIPTGFFLSLGSKFWHDLVDLLLHIKEARRKIATLNKAGDDPNIRFQVLPYGDQKKIIDDFIDIKYEQYRQLFPGINGMYAGYKIKDGQRLPLMSLVVQVEKKKEKVLSEKFPPMIAIGEYQFPTDIVPVGKSEFHRQDHQYYGYELLPNKTLLGASISRNGEITLGSLSVVAYKGNNKEKKYLLSCYHVLCRDEWIIGQYKYNNEKNIDAVICGYSVGRDVKRVGKIVQGEFSEICDAAIVEFNDQFNIENTPYDLDPIIGYIKSFNELKYGQECYSSGTISGKVKTSIREFNFHKTVSVNGRDHTFTNIIQIGICSTYGDSGAPVVTKNNKLIGIIIGGDDFGSYCIPFFDIKNRLNIDI